MTTVYQETIQESWGKNVLKPRKRKEMRVNTVRLRVIIGILGALLPWIVCGLIGFIPPSISATWYSNANTPFMIILGSASLLLMSYKGYEPMDDILLTLCGIFGLMICLFPCKNPLIEMLQDFLELDAAAAEEMLKMDMPALQHRLRELFTMNQLSTKELMMLETFLPYSYTGTVGAFHTKPEVSAVIHNYSAIAFFALLSLNSIFMFTKSDSNPTCKRKLMPKLIKAAWSYLLGKNRIPVTKKECRNGIYIVCGCGMILSFLILPFSEFFCQLWLVEAIALACFGISFLTKADVFPWLFCDDPKEKDRPLGVKHFRFYIIRKE